MVDKNELGLVPEPRFLKVVDGTFKGNGTALDSVDALLACVEKVRCDCLHFASIWSFHSALIEEAYILDVSETSIRVHAVSDAGFFYAEMTLKQLYMTYGGNIPCVYIEDIPEYEWRGFMLDVCRTFYPVEFVLKMIDAAAFHKLNRFHWHLTDDQGWRFNVPEYPKLTEIGAYRKSLRLPEGEYPKGGFYTDDEIRKVVEYAAARHITVVPEVETPGHASAILASYPELGCTGGPYAVEDRFGIFDDVLCAGNDAVFTVFEKIFDTVCRLFPGPYVHIGGDECPRTRWKECPKCQFRMKQEGLSGENLLQSYLTAKFAKMLEARGRVPIGWDEVLDGSEKFALPNTLVVQSWRGMEGGEKASALGHKTIMSPNTAGCYLDYKHLDSPMEPGNLGVITVKDSYSFSPVSVGMSEGARKNVLGGQGNLWTELIYAPKIAEYMVFPRLCALSESFWLPVEEKDFKSFSARLSVHKKRLDDLDFQYYRGPLE